MAKKVAICPICGRTIDVTKERRESFNCPFCGSALIRAIELPKGELVRIDGRYTT